MNPMVLMLLSQLAPLLMGQGSSGMGGALPSGPTGGFTPPNPWAFNGGGIGLSGGSGAPMGAGGQFLQQWLAPFLQTFMNLSGLPPAFFNAMPGSGPSVTTPRTPTGGPASAPRSSPPRTMDPLNPVALQMLSRLGRMGASPPVRTPMGAAQ